MNDQVRAALSSRLRFHPDDDQAVQLWDTTEMFVFMDAFMLGFQIFLGIMGVLTLVVGGIGVSNIMNVVVEERTREIGIKMALGARSRAILTQFMLETMILTAVGGASGSPSRLRSARPSGQPRGVRGAATLSPGLAVLTASILGLVGFVAGYFRPRRLAPRPGRRHEAVIRRSSNADFGFRISDLPAADAGRTCWSSGSRSAFGSP